jgi:hypothetical protein
VNPRLGGGMHWAAREYMDFLDAYKKGKIKKTLSCLDIQKL